VTVLSKTAKKLTFGIELPSLAVTIAWTALLITSTHG
jgi:hypothetical protein